MENPRRQNFFRAGHAHAGVIVILSLVGESGTSLSHYDEEANSFRVYRVQLPEGSPSDLG